MALPVILGGMWILSKKIDKKEHIAVSNDSLIIPEVDEIEDSGDDKAKIYRDEQSELLHKRHSDARNVASDKDFFAIDSDFGKEETKQEAPIDKETQQVLAQYQEPEHAQNKSVIQPKKEKQPEKTTTQNTNASNHQSTEQDTPFAAVEEKPKRRSSMGIYTADRSTPDSPAETKIDQARKYLKAVLEEEKTIQNGSNVIFVLSEDGIIQGTKHKRGSILYGRAMQEKEFFEINIYQLKSTNDGNTYPADLVVFDENYNRGIRSEGFLNETSREEGTDAVTESLDDATKGATSVRALDAATRAITRTVSKTQRNKPITVPLRKGYKVYLQPKEKEK